MQCCGQECLTPYCPECGKQMRRSLRDLVDHLRGLQKEAAEKITRARERLEVNPLNGTYQRGLRNAQLAESKWQTWADDLQALLDRPAP
jgi:hypothetical protein